MPLTGSERILVVKPSSLGDVVHTLPAVASLRRAVPDATIDWLVNTEWAPLLGAENFVDEVIPFPRKELKGFRGLLGAKRWAAETFASREYDLAIDFQGLLRSALLSKLSGARRVHGFAQAREKAHCLYQSKIVVPSFATLHAIDRYRLLVDALEVDTQDVTFPLPAGESVAIPEAFQNKAVVLHPFSRGLGKSLSTQEVIELCEALAPLPVWIVGYDETAATVKWPENTYSFLNQTSLSELIYLLREAAFTISVDSGPMHLAAAISPRVLSLHTWTNPAVVGPRPKESAIACDETVVQVKDLGPSQFPERRYLKKQFAGRNRLFTPTALDRVANFVRDRVAS